MALFTDNIGREWSIEFDGILLDRVNSETGIDFGDLTAKAYSRIQTDVSALVKVLCVLCSDQIAAKKLDRQQFAKEIRKDAFASAIAAIMAAAADFFPAQTWSEMDSSCEAVMSQVRTMRPMAPIMAMLDSKTVPDRMKDALMLILEEQIRSGSLSAQSEAGKSVSGQDVTQSSAATESQAS